MADIAELNIKVATSEVKNGTKDLSDLEKQGAKTERSMDSLSKTARKLAGYFAAWKITSSIKDASLLAARYETLGVTLKTAGKNAGYTQTQMALLEKQLQAQGIAAVESREVLTRMAAAYMDLTQASKLAAAAQNLAVAGGINSSQAFERLVYAIQSGQTEMLRTIGLNVQFDEAYKDMAASVGKTVSALSTQEKMQARVNIVLKKAEGYNGLYTESMKTAGKQITSFARYWQDLQLEFGKSQLPAVTQTVELLKIKLKEATEYLSEEDIQKELAGIGETAIETTENLLKFGVGVGKALGAVLKGWNALPEVIQQYGLLALVGGKAFGAKGAAVVAVISAYAAFESKMKSMAQIDTSDGLDWTEKFSAWVHDLEYGTNQLERLKAISSMKTAFADTDEFFKKRTDKAAVRTDVTPTTKTAVSSIVSDKDKQKIEAARAALISLRKEIEVIQARQSGSSTAELLGIDKSYADRVAQIQKKIKNTQTTSGEKGILRQQLAVEKQKYSIERSYAEKRIQLEQNVKAASLDVQLAELQGVDTYEAQKAAITAKYAQMRLQYKSLDAQAADKMEAAEKAALDRNHASGLAEQRAEYAKLTHNSKAYYQAQLDTIEAQRTGNETLQEQLILQEKIATLQAKIRGDGWYAAKDAIKEYADSATDSYQNIHDGISSMASSTEDAFVNIIAGTKNVSESFRDLASSILSDLARITVRQSITGPLSSWIGTLFSAHGNAFGPSGLHAFAKGGAFTNSIVSSPTLFQYANGGALGVMGEKGDEGILPLTRTRTGNLGVEASGINSGGGMVLNVTQNFELPQSSGDSKQDQDYLDAAAKTMEKSMTALVNDRFRDELRPGGMLNRGNTI